MNLAAILPGFARPRAHTRVADSRPARGAVLAPAQRALARHATMQLENTELRLRVLRGCVWITRDSCPMDVVLEAGQYFDQRPGARVLVHALQDAQFLLVAAADDAQNR